MASSDAPIDIGHVALVVRDLDKVADYYRDVIGLEPLSADGPEYSPDGQWIWFNWEMNGRGAGHAQLFRMRPDGSQKEQMTFDDEVNWFPHFSPDGKEIIFLTYPSGTISHPADVNLRIRKIPAGGGEPVDVVSFFGGQGSLNVNSWSPDSQRFAYVEYPELTRA